MFGGTFKDEAKGLKKKFDRPGLLAMANGGKNSNTSQFFISTAELPELEGKHVVFGEVVEGLDVVEKIQAYYKANGDDGKEGWKEGCNPVFIWKCGVV